jgi:Family of unknown function (DUF6062)
MEMSWAMRAAKQPSRHLTYHDLSEALAQAGCAVCRLVAIATDRYLRSLLYESVNDPWVRERLRASQGFCRAHAWHLQRRGDPLGISILWRDLLTQASESGKGPQHGKSKGRTAMCPACDVAAEAERRYLGTLVEHLAAGSLRQEYDTSAGLCLPHLRKAVRQGSAARVFLLESEAVKLSRLSQELAEIIRKNDYRFREEPWGAERDAWIRATRKLAGEPPEA